MDQTKHHIPPPTDQAIYVRPVTASFVAALEGAKLTPACVCDFGLDNGVAFGRLNTETLLTYSTGWKKKLFTISELDNALGSGPKLTKLLQRVSPNAQVSTFYDAMTANDLEEGKG